MLDDRHEELEGECEGGGDEKEKERYIDGDCEGDDEYEEGGRMGRWWMAADG